MEVIILAAGIGSRLASITNKKPKCLVNVGGQAILDHQIKSFIKSGIENITIVGGYKVNLIKENCINYKNFPINIIVNEDYLTTNNMYSLYLLRKKLSGKEFILCNGDVIFEPQIVDSFVNSHKKNIIAVDKGRYLEESMKIVVNNDNQIIDISKIIPINEAFGSTIDLYKFSEDFSLILFEEISKIIESENNKKEWFEVALQRVFQKSYNFMQPFDIEGRRWVEIDSLNDLIVADYLFNSIGDLRQKKVFLFDLDGTIYNGDKLISNAKEVIEKLKLAGKKIFFISNNSSKSKVEYVQKLNSFGLDIHENDIILSTDGVILYLKKNKIYDIFLIGTESMKELFESSGINTDSNNPKLVVLGYDTELTYEKIKKASYFLQKNVKMIVSHCDIVCPSPKGFLPDAGSILALFEKAHAINPEKIFGKPNPEMIEHIIKEYGPDNIVIIGDRLYTDIELAKRTGIKSICVLSGETKREHIEDSQLIPDLIIKDIGKIIDLMDL